MVLEEMRAVTCGDDLAGGSTDRAVSGIHGRGD
jgi:hypothetical protein